MLKIMEHLKSTDESRKTTKSEIKEKQFKINVILMHLNYFYWTGPKNIKRAVLLTVHSIKIKIL